MQVTGDEYVGDAGTGSFDQSGGTHSVGGTLFVARYFGSSGSYSLETGGRLDVTDDEWVGGLGTGSFEQDGGVHSIGRDLFLGDTVGYALGRGSYTLSGSGQLSVGRNESVGPSGTGSFAQTGGTHIIGLNLMLGGYETGAMGNYALSGNGNLEVHGNEDIGEAGSGKFDQSGGTQTIDGSLTIAGSYGSSGTYNLNSGSLTVPALIDHDTFNYSGGDLNVQTLEISSGGRMTVAAGLGKALRVDSLTVDTASGSKLDLNDNDLVVSYGTNPSPFVDIENLVFTGYRDHIDTAAGGIVSSTRPGVAMRC